MRASAGFPLLPVLLWVIVLAVAVRATDSFAFSFEKIDIQSKFGERFLAELDVLLEEDGEFQVQIGDSEDYQRLELERPKIIDDLEIVASTETAGKRRTLQVVSGSPLFYPSFYLVIRGAYKGGTLLENYLVTVDFQQNLALNVKNPKNKKQKESISPNKEKVDLLQGGEAAENLTVDAETPKQAKAEAVKGEDENAIPLLDNDQNEPSGIPSRVNAPSWMAKPPAELQGVRGKDSFFPGATWVSPRIFPDKMPPMDSPQSAVDAEQATNQVSTKESMEPQQKTPSNQMEATPVPKQDLRVPVSSESGYGPLAQGENLFSVVKKLNYAASDANRVAVALWMDNPDSFLYGNMNGIKSGSRLNLESLEKRLEEIDSQRAREVLDSQWREWQLMREKLAAVPSDVFKGLTQEIPLPSETEDEKKMIFEMLRDWKETWEMGDLDRHLAHFSDRSSSQIEQDFANIRFLKKRMFVRHNQVKLRIQQASLVLNEGETMVSFGQSFSSGKMESYGRKDIGVVWEDGAWKILKEKFKVNEYLEKHESDDLTTSADEEIFSRERTIAVPFVIHASSHLDFSMATQAVNQLRRLGYNAYSSPVNISRNRKIFRVYVGRFPSMDLAGELATKLKRNVFSRYAIPVNYPYAFMMGEFASENEAETLILNLRSVGFSPLLFTFSEKEFLNPRFRVYLGAFAAEKDSRKLSNELTAHNFPHKLVTH